MAKIVYSTDPESRRPCEECGRPRLACVCGAPAIEDAAPAEQTIRIAREKRQKGKIVTVSSGFRHAPGTLERLAKTLKARCGAGGAADAAAGAIEIQGDQRERVAEVLRALGYRVKVAG